MRRWVLIKDDGSSPPTYGILSDSLEKFMGHPPCGCTDCQAAYFTLREQCSPLFLYRRKLSDADAGRVVLLSLKRIHNARAKLTDRLDIFADVLLSRWKKFSQAKRESLLKEAAPDLEQDKWLIPRCAYMRERHYAHARSPRRRRQLLLPWLSVAALKTNPAMLVALLHYRTAYPPQQWAAFDTRQLALGWATGFFDVDFSAKCVVMQGIKYGELVDWTEKAAHRADILGFPRAMLVLEAQAYLMEVLWSIATKILDGVDSSQSPRTGKWNSLVTNAAFRETGVVETWSSYTNPAFSPPPEFDSKYLVSLAKSRVYAFGDHLWHLQCDSAYMRRYLKILFATALFKKTSDTNQAVLVTEHLRFEVENYHWWRWIETECRHVDAAQEGFHDSICPGTKLPLYYNRVLGALELLLVRQVMRKGDCLNELLPFVAGLQKHWVFKSSRQDPDDIGIIYRNACPNTPEALTNDPLDWCLNQLLKSSEDPRNFDHAMLFAMLQEHMSSNPSERVRLDEVIYQTLSDLSTCHEMLQMVRFHRPRNTERTLADAGQTEDRPAWKQLRSIMKPIDIPIQREIGLSLMRDFYVPKPLTGPKTAAWLAQSRALRVAVETFWESIRGTVKAEFQNSVFSAAEVDELVEVISANLSDEYLQNRQRENEAILAAIQESNKPAPVTSFFEGDTTPIKTAPRLEKTKTRGIQTNRVDDTTPAHGTTTSKRVENTSSVEATTIEVSKQSLEVFLLMFPEKNVATKDVLWDRFVHAMQDAGFSARKSGGSSVSFQKINEEGKIVFHKPHPIPKIDPIMLQTMGKRMAKWFGWRRELFVLQGGGV